MKADVRIEAYRSEFAAAFASLNLEWIASKFAVEDADRAVLLNPQGSIIERGGSILFAVCDSDVMGCVALKPLREGVLELTKMAVREDHRGHGVGALLMQAAIDEAQRLGASSLVLDTHSSLHPAIALYHRFGFERMPVGDSPYRRTDVSMRRRLGASA
ncbi:MAG: GNAT family N-acetyltransferase [Tahibacter sp.]